MLNQNHKNFALIGAAGFVSPWHMKAIKETGNNLLAAYDINDSVGVMDSFFPEADFFVQFERFDRHIDLLRRSGKTLDYVSIVSPNYLHDSHIRFGLHNDAEVICEKPLVLNPRHIDPLADVSRETGKKVYNILQLRLHPSMIALKEKYKQVSIPQPSSPKKKAKSGATSTPPNIPLSSHPQTSSPQPLPNPSTKVDIDLTYISSHGHWYYASWKGDLQKSGGIASHIGVHFFDALMWIFGPVQRNVVHVQSHDRAAGFLELERARIRWFLSTNANTLPEETQKSGKLTWRSITINNEEFELNDGFDDLHTLSYQAILNGGGFLLEEARPAIELVHCIRHQRPVGLVGDYHPLAALPLAEHPFIVKR